MSLKKKEEVIELKEQTEPVKYNASLFHFYRKNDIGLLIATLLVSTGSGLAFPILTILLGNIFSALSQFTANAYSKEEFMKQVLLSAIGIFSLGFGAVILVWMSVTFWCLFGGRQVERGRVVIFSSLINKDLTWFDLNRQVMGMLTLIHGNMEDIQMATTISASLIAQSSISIIASAILAFYHSWSLSLITLAGIPIVIVISVLCAKPMNTNIAANKKYLESSSDLINWALSSIISVKLFNNESFEVKCFKKESLEGYKFYVRFANFLALQQGLTRIFVLSMFVQGFYYGSYLVKTGRIQSGSVLTVFWCCVMIAESFHNLNTQLAFVRKGQTAVNSLLQFNSDYSDPNKRKSIGIYPMNAANGHISFQNVSST